MRASHGIGRAEFSRQLGALLDRSGAYAQARLGDRGDAEDAVQEAALRAWRAMRRHLFADFPFRPLAAYCTVNASLSVVPMGIIFEPAASPSSVYCPVATPENDSFST